MRSTGVFLVTLVVLAASGCAPPIDMEAEREAVRQTAVEWVDAANAKDVERMVALYTDDASLFPPNATLVTGKEGIGGVWSELVGRPGFASALETTQVEISRAGDLAYSAGTYADTTTDADGNPVTERGKWVVVLKKQPDGSWKIVVDIWNPDQPAASE